MNNSTGEYVLEVRSRTDVGDQDSVDGTTEWIYGEWHPSVVADPLTDRNDMATEEAAQRMRELATKLNRELGWYGYRTVYVSADRSCAGERHEWNGRFGPGTPCECGMQEMA